MTTLKFADSHNMVAFLTKFAESEGFEQIVDFLNANPIRYALTINPTIYASCIKQFWATVKMKTVNGEVQLQALVDGKKIIITEATLRRDLQLEDAEGIDCLPKADIFEQLTLMGMVKNLDYAGKFLMYPRPKRKDTQVPQPSDPTNVADEAVNEEPRITLDSTHFDADIDMFGVHDLDGDEVVVESEVAAKKKDDEVNVVKEVVSATEETVNAATITEDEITLAQALAELKSVKPKVTTAITTTTKGILLQEPSESITTTTTIIPSKDKGKGSEACKGKDEANVALIKEWNDIQANIDADYQMAKQMQAKEQEELSIEEKSKLFVQLLEARKKHFAVKRAEEKRNRPPTRAQQRSIIYEKGKHLDTELVEGNEVRADGSETREESSSKRAGDELEQEKAKKQKVDEDKEITKLQSLMEVIPYEEEVVVDATPLATKPPSIVDWKILKEGKISYYQIIRADEGEILQAFSLKNTFPKCSTLNTAITKAGTKLLLHSAHFSCSWDTLGISTLKASAADT
ncbi:hypothetical protein Tco_0625780 [Tanacetum coccineum]|uniref:Xylulose kinase-1 n=1 Tax=Tanacetum coccineum TaxID=301880 RepID=A0ABQ4WHW5_9ASTR